MTMDTNARSELPDIAADPTAGQKGGGTSRRILSAAAGTWSFRIGLAVFVLLVAASIILPLLLSTSATKISVGDRFLPPAIFEGGRAEHLLGTDQLGRDL